METDIPSRNANDWSYKTFRLKLSFAYFFGSKKTCTPHFCIYYKYILIYNIGEKMQTAKLFKNGQSQAVRLPKEFRFEGEQVYLKKLGNAVVLFPVKGSWTPLFESLEEFSSDFMESREQPAHQIREEF